MPYDVRHLAPGTCSVGQGFVSALGLVEYAVLNLFVQGFCPVSKTRFGHGIFYEWHGPVASFMGSEAWVVNRVLTGL